MHLPARGHEVLGVGDLHAVFLALYSAQREDVLHDALAVGLGTDHQGAAAVLQAAGEDLAGRGGSAVDQDHQGDIVLPGLGVALLAVAGAVLAVEEQLLVQEDVGDLFRRVHPAAGIIAQVQDQGGGALLFQLLHVGGQTFLAVAGELVQRDQADVVLQHGHFRPVHVDDGAADGIDDVLPFADDFQLHGVGFLAAHQVGGFGHVFRGDLQIVHPDEDVALADPGLLGGGVFEHAADGDDVGVIVGQHLDADAGIVALVVFPEALPGFGRIIEGIVVSQALQHPPEGAFHHLFLVRLFIVILLDLSIDLGQLAETLQLIVLFLGNDHFVGIEHPEEIKPAFIFGRGADGTKRQDHRQGQRQNLFHV